MFSVFLVPAPRLVDDPLASVCFVSTAATAATECNPLCRHSGRVVQRGSRSVRRNAYRGGRGTGPIIMLQRIFSVCVRACVPDYCVLYARV
uniref:Uncharacterized protein n=1 Tax=Ixodes scapularis TaxID=6945 RepID=A0A4D5RXA4_IXOSC